MLSKLKACGTVRISLEVTWLLARRQSAHRPQEHNTGVYREQENLRPWCKEKSPSESNVEDESIDARHRGGATRISDEVSVMEMERRGGSSLVLSWSTEREEPIIGPKWSKPCKSRGLRTVVCPKKAGMFSRRQSCQGSSQKPCSLNGREEGNQIPEAHWQSHLKDDERVTRPQRK